MDKLDYRIKYFIHLFTVSTLLLVSIIVIVSVLEIIKTKSLFIKFDISFISLIIAFIGIAIYSFLMSVIYVPLCAEPSTITINFKNIDEKNKIINEADYFIINYKSSNAQRKLKETNKNVIIYKTGNKYLDWLTSSIILTESENYITISGPNIYIDKIKKLKFNQNEIR